MDMKTYYLRGGQDVNCYMIDAVGEDGSYCKTEDCQAKIDELKSDLAEAYKELRQQRPTIRGVFNRTVWDKAEHRKE